MIGTLRAIERGEQVFNAGGIELDVVRDKPAHCIVVDTVAYSLITTEIIDQLDMSDSDKDVLNNSLIVLRAVDVRHRTKFRYYVTGSPFEYELVRLLYNTKRELDIEK